MSAAFHFAAMATVTDHRDADLLADLARLSYATKWRSPGVEAAQPSTAFLGQTAMSALCWRRRLPPPPP